MPVLTPTYPHINSTFNVTPTTLKLIQDKMVRARQLCEQIFRGEEQWTTLFKVSFRREGFRYWCWKKISHFIVESYLSRVQPLPGDHSLRKYLHQVVWAHRVEDQTLPQQHREGVLQNYQGSEVGDDVMTQSYCVQYLQDDLSGSGRVLLRSAVTGRPP